MKENTNIQGLTFNFRRFYALLSRMAARPGVDADELKRMLVSQETQGRTESLHELTVREYDSLCETMSLMAVSADSSRATHLRHRRSIALGLMQSLGIDTTDWQRVNQFCRDPRIAGCDFRHLTPTELEALARKLRAILRAGGLKGNAAEPVKPASRQKTAPTVMVFPMSADC